MSSGRTTSPALRFAAWTTAAGAMVAGAMVLVVLAFLGLGGGAAVAAPSSVPGLSPVLLDAYVRAAASGVAPECTGVRWSVLAGIAQIESNQAAGHVVGADGTITPPIIGIALDGSSGTQLIADTDGGRWDGDTVYDRAVGPFQFIPGSWVVYGRDGNGDGVADPNNVYDAAVGAVVHLCGAGPRNLLDEAQLRAAIFGYNHSTTYVDEVMAAITSFDAFGAAADGPPPAGSERGAAVVAIARAWLGTPYLWGGNTPLVGLDCSGMTQQAYLRVGITLPRTAALQFAQGETPGNSAGAVRIDRSAGLAALAPGDLVFFASDPVGGTGVHHVGMYVGAGQMINAPHTGAVVRIEAVWMSGYAGATRYP